MATEHAIFISYRRSDLSLEAEWLYRLIETFCGPDVAFFDRQEITPGTRWDDTLRTGVSRARRVFVLIGPAWLKEQAPSGMRRLDEPEDWVRREVAAAVESYTQRPDHTRVYPVLVNGATLPPRTWLPPALAELSSFQLEPALQFHIADYLDQAALIHGFLREQWLEMQGAGWVPPRPMLAFDRERVPNPYDITGYPLPEAMRLQRPALPYRGLDYFRREDAPIFFGRNREIGEIIDAFKKGRRFIRLFGQSGVGKSSLLFAGLFPRLEGNGWHIRYFRRDPRVPLATSLETLAQSLPQDDAHEALIILDQVEEVLTNPNPAAPGELEDLAAAAARLLAQGGPGGMPIRLLWAYRKEYDANVKAPLREHGVYSTEYWLKDLDRRGTREAIVGITRDRDLQAEYRLELEDGLEDLVIGDLLDRGQRENATPLLQVLLRQMWDRVSAATRGTRRFTREVYEACKRGDLVVLLQEQLNALARRPGLEDLRPAVEAGLALDLLNRFVTDQDTSLSLAEPDLVQAYADEAALRRLLQALVDHYLLVRDDSGRYRLSHDTLARAVRVQHARSMRPGQRAARLLDSKAGDLELQPQAVDFSRADLRSIDEGAIGMRRLTARERTAVDESRRRHEQAALDLEQKNLQLQQALASERSNFLNLQASQEPDLTTAIRLCQEAVNLSPSREALRNLYRCYDAAYAAEPSTPLRRTLVAGHSRVAAILAGEVGLLFSGGDDQASLYRHDFDGADSRRLPIAGSRPIQRICGSPFGLRAVVTRTDGSAAVVDLVSLEVQALALPPEVEHMLFLDADRLVLHHRSHLVLADLATGQCQALLDMPGDELISTFEVAPDRDRLLIATRQKRLCEYEFASGELRVRFEFEQIVSHLHFVGPTQVLLCDMSRSVVHLDLATGDFSTVQARNNQSFIPGLFLFAGAAGAFGFTQSGDAGEIQVRMDSVIFLLRCRGGDFFKGLMLAPQRRLAITTGFSGIVLWRLHRSSGYRLHGRVEPTFLLGGAATSWYFAAYPDKIVVADIERGRQADVVISGVELQSSTTAMAADLLAFGTGVGSFVLADLADGNTETVALDFAAKPFGLHLGAGKVWLTDELGGLHLYDPGSRQWSHHDFGQIVHALAFDAGGRVAIGLADGSVSVAPVNEPTRPLQRFRKLSTALLCLAWSPDGRRLLAGGYNSFGVLTDLETGAYLKLQHSHWLSGAAFSADGALLATTSPDGIVRIFDSATGEVVRSLQPGHDPVHCRFSPDGSRLLVVLVGNKTVFQWVLATATEIAERLQEFAIDVPQPAPIQPETEGPFRDELPPMVNMNRISFR